MKPHGLYLKRLTAEIAPAVIGGIVHGVRTDPGRSAFVLYLDTLHGKRFVQFGPRAPALPLLFARKRGELPRADDFTPAEKFNRLRGRRLADFAMPIADRVIVLSFDPPLENDKPPLALHVRYTGSAANAILIDADARTMLETFWKAPSLSIGDPLPDFPTPGLPDLFRMAFPEFLRAADDAPDFADPTIWSGRFWGLSGEIADEIATRIETHVDAIESVEWRQWSTYRTARDCISEILDPATGAGLRDDPDEGRRVALPFRPSTVDDDHWHGTASFADAVRETAADSVVDSVRAQVRRGLTRWLDDEVRHLTRRVDDACGAVERRSTAAVHGAQGDLLAANFHLLKKGMTEIELDRLVDDGGEAARTTIPLDPKLSPRENVERCYRRRKKTLAAADTALGQIAELQPKLDELTALRQNIASVPPGDDLPVEIMQRARTAGFVHIAPTAKSSLKGLVLPKQRLPYREFEIDGWAVRVGKSNRDNDELTFKHAHKEDLFLHAQQCPGSHVILRQWAKKTEFPEDIVRRAAEVAAYFSKARTSAKVPVLVASVKYVRKPRKAALGKVLVERERSMMVTPAPPPGYHDA